MRSIANLQSACLCVCLCVCFYLFCVLSHISKTTLPNFNKFPVHVTCGRGFVLFWRFCGWCRMIRYHIVDLRALKSWRKGHLNLAHGIKQKTKTIEETKNTKERMDQNQRRRVCFIQFTRWRHRDEVCRLWLHAAHTATGRTERR